MFLHKYGGNVLTRNTIGNKQEDESYKISIIVPVYKVEQYLDRCIESLIEQTYSNLEIILVDDGSPDKCGQICDLWEKVDHRIKVLHMENRGLSGARNAGMKICTGDYIGFVDSDDWIEKDMYEYLLGLIQEYNADAAQVWFAFADKYPYKVKEIKECIAVRKSKDILQSYMERSTSTGSYSVWKCLFSRKALEGEFFREGKINEDIDFKYRVLRKCKVFVESNLPKYYYFQATGSITTSGLKRKDLDLYDAAEELCKLTQDEDYGTIRKLGEVKRARTAFSLLSKIAYYGISDETIQKEEIIKKLQLEHRENYKILLEAPIPRSRKVLSVMFAISFPITEMIIKIYAYMRTILRS